MERLIRYLITWDGSFGSSQELSKLARRAKLGGSPEIKQKGRPFEPAFPYFLQPLKRCDGSQVDFGMHKATQIDAAPAKNCRTSD